jgi:hypothetical protein
MASTTGSKKKVIVTTGVSEMTPEEMINHARSVKKTCGTSQAFLASKPCQDAMDAWMTRTDELEAHLQDRKAKENAASLAVAEEPGAVNAYSNAADGFAAAVQADANDDPTIPLEMGMALRAQPSASPDVIVPTGVGVLFVKRTSRRKVTWDPVPGAVLYNAQMKLDSAPDSGWETLFGNGTSRLIPVLVPGQTYMLRVQAVGLDGVPSAWSETVLFLAK